MGYDMHQITKLTDAEQTIKDLALDRFNTAVAERKATERGTADYEAAQAKVDAAYEAMDGSDPGYFRLNIWGMGRCYEYMAKRGMVYDAASPGPWPAYPELGPDATDEEEEAAEAKYEELSRPLKAAHPDGGDTIPGFKFGSNDGWIVTPAECAAALAANAGYTPPTYLDDDGTEKPVTWWDEWLRFLQRGADNEGFTVH